VVSYFLMEADGEEATAAREGEKVEAVEQMTPKAAVAMLT